MPLPISMVTQTIQDETGYTTRRYYLEENPPYLMNTGNRSFKVISILDDQITSNKSVLVNNLHEFLSKTNIHKSQKGQSPDVNSPSLSSEESRNAKSEKTVKAHYMVNHTPSPPFQYEIRESGSTDLYNTKLSEKENRRRNRSFRIDGRNDEALEKKDRKKKQVDKRKRSSPAKSTPSVFLHDRQVLRKEREDKKLNSTIIDSPTCIQLNISSKLRKPTSVRKKKSSKKNRSKHETVTACSSYGVRWTKSTSSNNRKKLTTKPKVRKLSLQQKKELYSSRPDLMPDHWSSYSRLRHYILRRTWALELAIMETMNKICTLPFDDESFDKNSYFFIDGKLCMCF